MLFAGGSRVVSLRHALSLLKRPKNVKDCVSKMNRWLTKSQRLMLNGEPVGIFSLIFEAATVAVALIAAASHTSISKYVNPSAFCCFPFCMCVRVSLCSFTLRRSVSS